MEPTFHDYLDPSTVSETYACPGCWNVCSTLIELIEHLEASHPELWEEETGWPLLKQALEDSGSPPKADDDE